MNQRMLRRLATVLVPAMVVLTVACGLGYVEALRAGANDPQEQLAADAARALSAGTRPADLVGAGSAAAGGAGAGPVDAATSLAPFVTILDATGTVLASNGVLDGAPPVPPPGVLAAARSAGHDAVTWQPRTGVRIATVVVPWSGGTVVAGRSLRLVEDREDVALRLAGLAWLAGLVLLIGAAVVATWLGRAAVGRADR